MGRNPRCKHICRGKTSSLISQPRTPGTCPHLLKKPVCAFSASCGLKTSTALVASRRYPSSRFFSARADGGDSLSKNLPVPLVRRSQMSSCASFRESRISRAVVCRSPCRHGKSDRLKKILLHFQRIQAVFEDSANLLPTAVLVVHDAQHLTAPDRQDKFQAFIFSDFLSEAP